MIKENGASPITKRRGKLIAIIIVVVVIIVAVVGGALYWKSCKKAEAKTEGYQAVFLSNGQVYFGKISNLYSDYVGLSDIYYLQLTNQLQTQQPPATGDQAAQQQQKLSLIKLGNELHGPKDTMYINQKHVLFIENLKDDSKVVQAINQYKDQQAKDANTNATK